MRRVEAQNSPEAPIVARRARAIRIITRVCLPGDIIVRPAVVWLYVLLPLIAPLTLSCVLHQQHLFAIMN